MYGARLSMRAKLAWALFVRVSTTIMLGGFRGLTGSVKTMWRDERAAMDPSNLINSIIAVVIVAAIVAATIGLFFTSIADVNAELDNADLNDSTANTIAGIYPIVLGIAAVLAIVGLILAAIKFRR